GGLMVIALTVAVLLLRPGVLTWGLVARAVAGLLLLAILLTPFIAPYLAIHTALGYERDLGQAQVASMDLVAILDPGDFNRPYRGWLTRRHGVEGGLFPGFVPLALCVLAAGWVVLRDPPGGSAVDGGRIARRVLAGLTLLGVTAVTVAAVAAAARTGERLV